jgi:glycosyltransferase involved in cell wall biosynthesis
MCIKVLALMEDLPIISGGRMAFVTMINHLQKMGLDILLVSTKGATQTKTEVPSFRISVPSDRILRYLYYLTLMPFRLFLETLSCARTKVPDIFLVNQGFIAFYGVLLSRIFHRPVVILVHDAVALPEVLRGNLGNKVWRLFNWISYDHFLRYFDKILAVSPFTAKGLSTKALKKNISVVGCPVEIPQEESCISENPTIINIGRLDINKGPLDFIRIARLVKRRLPLANVVWLGKGKCLEEYRSLAEGVVSFVGEVSEEEKNKWLSKAWVLLNTSDAEGFGIPIAEALIYGKIVVAYDLEVYRSVYDGHINRVSSRNCEDMASKTVDIILNYGDCLVQREEGRRYVLNNYSATVVAQKVRDALVDTLRHCISWHDLG